MPLLPPNVTAIYVTFDWDPLVVLAIFGSTAVLAQPYSHRLAERDVEPLMYAMQQCGTPEEKRTMFWNAVRAGQIRPVV